MNNNKKKSPWSPFNAAKEWEMLQPQRDEVKAENHRPRRVVNIERNSKSAVKRAKKEHNNQNQMSASFLEERQNILGIMVEAQKHKVNFKFKL